MCIGERRWEVGKHRGYKIVKKGSINERRRAVGKRARE
eukprot:gene66-3382_t